MLQPLYSEGSSESGRHFRRIYILDKPKTILTPIDAESAEQEIEDEGQLKHMFEKSPITTRLSRPQEPPSDQSTSLPSLKMDKGKAKMSEYEDDHFNDNESTHSLDSEFGGFDVPIGAKKPLISANENLHRSTREKNPVNRFSYNDYMAYHYALMMKVAIVRCRAFWLWIIA